MEDTPIFTLRFTFAMILALWATVRSAAASGPFTGSPSPQFKQLAGPPAEMDAMKAPDPASYATHSKSALLLVNFEKRPDGRWIWSVDIPVESGELRFAVISGASAAKTKPWDVMIGEQPVAALRGSHRRSSL